METSIQKNNSQTNPQECVSILEASVSQSAVFLSTVDKLLLTSETALISISSRRVGQQVSDTFKGTASTQKQREARSDTSITTQRCLRMRDFAAINNTFGRLVRPSTFDVNSGPRSCFLSHRPSPPFPCITTSTRPHCLPPLSLAHTLFTSRNSKWPMNL